MLTAADFLLLFVIVAGIISRRVGVAFDLFFVVAFGIDVLVAEVVAGRSLTGGGSAPGEGLPTALVALRVQGVGAKAFEARLRGRPVPVIARIEEDALILDLRTVAPEEEEALLSALVGLAG